MQLDQLSKKADKFISFFIRLKGALTRGERTIQFRSEWKALSSDLVTATYADTIRLPGGRQFRFDLAPSVDNLIALISEVYGLKENFARFNTRREKLDYFCILVNCVATIESPEPPSGVPWTNAGRVEYLATRTQAKYSGKACFASAPENSNSFQQGLLRKLKALRSLSPVTAHVNARLAHAFPWVGFTWSHAFQEGSGDLSPLMILMALPVDTRIERRELYFFIKGEMSERFHPFAAKHQILEKVRPVLSK